MIRIKKESNVDMREKILLKSFLSKYFNQFYIDLNDIISDYRSVQEHGSRDKIIDFVSNKIKDFELLNLIIKGVYLHRDLDFLEMKKNDMLEQRRRIEDICEFIGRIEENMRMSFIPKPNINHAMIAYTDPSKLMVRTSKIVFGDKTNDGDEGIDLAEMDKLMKIYLMREKIKNYKVENGVLYIFSKYFTFELTLCGLYEDPKWKIIKATHIYNSKNFEMHVIRAVDGSIGKIIEFIEFYEARMTAYEVFEYIDERKGFYKKFTGVLNGVEIEARIEKNKFKCVLRKNMHNVRLINKPLKDLINLISKNFITGNFFEENKYSVANTENTENAVNITTIENKDCNIEKRYKIYSILENIIKRNNNFNENYIGNKPFEYSCKTNYEKEYNFHIRNLILSFHRNKLIFEIKNFFVESLHKTITVELLIVDNRLIGFYRKSENSLKEHDDFKILQGNQIDGFLNNDKFKFLIKKFISANIFIFELFVSVLSFSSVVWLDGAIITPYFIIESPSKILLCQDFEKQVEKISHFYNLLNLKFGKSTDSEKINNDNNNFLNNNGINKDQNDFKTTNTTNFKEPNNISYKDTKLDYTNEIDIKKPNHLLYKDTKLESFKAKNSYQILRKAEFISIQHFISSRFQVLDKIYNQRLVFKIGNTAISISTFLETNLPFLTEDCKNMSFITGINYISNFHNFFSDYNLIPDVFDENHIIFDLSHYCNDVLVITKIDNMYEISPRTIRKKLKVPKHFSDTDKKVFKKLRRVYNFNRFYYIQKILNISNVNDNIITLDNNDILILTPKIIKYCFPNQSINRKLTKLLSMERNLLQFFKFQNK